MGLETATYPKNLNASWPLGSDSKTQGDDHLRLIKKVLKSTFPAGYDDASLPELLQRYNYGNPPGVAEFAYGATTDMSPTKTKLGETPTFVATYWICQAMLTGRAGVAGVPGGAQQTCYLLARLWNVTDNVAGEEIYDVGRWDNFAGIAATRSNVLKIAKANSFRVTSGKSYKFEVFGYKGFTTSTVPIEDIQFLAHCLT